jgi:hypothetical protein
MTDRSRSGSGRDVGFPTSDQAGGASQQHPQQLYGHYDAEHNANAPGASENPLPAHLHDAEMRYQAFDVHPQQPVPGQFSGYGFPPQAPLGWDWTNSIDFSEFTNQYEPQGELVGELQHAVTTNDFSIPLPVAAVDSAYPVPYASKATTPNLTNAQNPLSPPPKPPSRPVVQTGMKRKAESEPDSAVSQTASSAAEGHQHHSKRPNKSRQSSAASLSSPIVTEPADARQSPMAQTIVAQASTEPAPQGNTEQPKRKEQSKGTGPQGRVIDVSTPRRVQESPISSGSMLPAGKVFPIQIGSELFRLSGASISSDGMHGPNSLAQFGKLRLLEHPHTFRISSVNSYTTTAVALVT